MKNYIIHGVAAQWGTFVSILRHYLEKFGVVQITDDKSPLGSRRKILIHRKALSAMYAGILFQVLQFFGALEAGGRARGHPGDTWVPMECFTYGCLFDTS